MTPNLRFAPDTPEGGLPTHRQQPEMRPAIWQPNEESAEAANIGDNLQDIPDAVDLKSDPNDPHGTTVDETWHRAGGGSPPTKPS